MSCTGLLMSLSSTSTSLNSTGTFNSNSSINSAQHIDRYAALKDLDEQLREVKDVFSSHQTLSNGTTSSSSPANPFKQPAGNPFQAAAAVPSAPTAIHQHPHMNGWQTDFGGTTLFNNQSSSSASSSSSSLTSSNTQMYSNLVMGISPPSVAGHNGGGIIISGGGSGGATGLHALQFNNGYVQHHQQQQQQQRNPFAVRSFNFS